MKSFYMPDSTLISGIHEWAGKERFLSVLAFLILPVVFIILNAISIRRIYFLSGNPKTIYFLQAVWFNVLIIIFSIFILVIYSF